MSASSLRVPPDPRLAPGAVASLAFVLYLVPGLVGQYGVFIDELHYIACAKHLASGLRGSPPARPVCPAHRHGDRRRQPHRAAGGRLSFGALTVFGTGLLAWRLGANRLGQVLASRRGATGCRFGVARGPRVTFAARWWEWRQYG